MQHRELKDARRVLLRLFELQAEGRSAASGTSGDTTSTGALGDELLTQLRQQGLMFNGVHEAQVQAVSRLDELKRDLHANNNRLSELKANLPETGAINKAMQRFHKETTTGLERIQVTQAGLVSAMEALKANERRGNALLEELRGQLSEVGNRLLELTSSDLSSDPTVVGEPEADRRLRALGPLMDSVQNALQRQASQLEAQQMQHSLQTERISQALSRWEKELKSTQTAGKSRETGTVVMARSGVEENAPSLSSQDARQLLQPVQERLQVIEESLHHLETLAENTDALAAQLGELQADVGLVLKARPVRGAGRSQSPYDSNLADEYYANLQKLIRVLIKNDKASTYALEAIQYLHESLQVQASLTALLSSTEFALRVSPRALEEGVVKPLVRELRGQSNTADAPANSSSTAGDIALRLPHGRHGFEHEVRGDDLETLREVRPRTAPSARWDEVEALQDQDLHAGELEQADISLPAHHLR